MNRNILWVLLVIVVAEVISLTVGTEAVRWFCTGAVIDAVAIYLVCQAIFGWDDKKKGSKKKGTRT